MFVPGQRILIPALVIGLLLAGIIAVETSGRRGSVAIALGPDLVGRCEFSADMQHARDLLPEMDRLFREHQWRPADVDQCYLSIGPGSFTGLRVAVAFARHFALATSARVCAVPTLDVIAENCRGIEQPPEHLAVVLDAPEAGLIFHRDAAQISSGIVSLGLADGDADGDARRFLRVCHTRNHQQRL